jgi:glucokinase
MFLSGMQKLMKTIGIDIGGTKIAVAAVKDDGRVVSQVRFPTEAAKGFPSGLRNILAAVEDVTKNAGWKIAELHGIGIGCAGPVDPLRGTIHNPHTLPTWDDCDLVSPLKQHFGIPVRMENDADAAAVGELRFGAGRNANPLVMLTFGTGIGFAALVDAQIYRGFKGEHPEAGHIPALPDGPECYCGSRGCFESLASGTAIDQAGKLAGFPGSHAVFEAANSGNHGAQQILNRALAATESAIWTILHTFLPERIILGGGLIDEHFEMFASAVRNAIGRAVLIPKGQVDVAKAMLGADAGVVGAAALMMK